MRFRCGPGPILLVLLAISASGCALPPIAEVEANRYARLETIGDWETTICLGGENYSVDPDEGAGAVRIPAGARIDVRRDVQFIERRFDRVYISICRSGLSFVPRDGEHYVLATVFQGATCGIELVRRDDESATGVAIVESAREPECPIPQPGP